MQKIIQPEAGAFLAKKRRRRLWTKVVSVLGCLVVFCTTYALILPAITAEKTVCGFEEHTHTDECYAPLTEEAQTVLSCTTESLGVHSHTETCYDADGNLICGQADYVVHTHDENCYDADGVLVCTLPERTAHVHTDACYTTETESHVHTDACYELQQGELICGLDENEEHQHSAECYEQLELLTCPLEEGALVSRSVLSCGEVQAPAHQHTESCFETVEPVRELICEIPEHVHTEACYEELTPGDPTADLETAADWEASMSGVVLTGDYRTDLLAIAETQLGYRESTRNFIIDEAGFVKGYTRYGEWYGIPYGDWCAMFVSFCLRYAEVPNFPYNCGCTTWINALSAEEYGLYEKAGEYEPQPGDIIFFDLDGDQASDHVGIVAELIGETETEPAKLRTIEGNAADMVCSVTYEADSAVILGFGRLPEKETGYTCEKTAHAHSQYCYGYDGSLLCPIEEHTHNEECKGMDTPAEGQILTVADVDYTVAVMPGPESGLPENIELTVTEIAEGTEEYETYFLQAEQALHQAGSADPLVFARFFDVRLISDGESVEPAAPVSVSITYADMEGLESADCHAVHFTDEGVELLDATAEKSENGDVSVTHIQSSFSVVGDVVTQAEDYSISTYADAPTAGLDHNVTFMVKIRDNWVKVGSCTYDTSAVGGRNASVSEGVLHQYLDNYGYGTETNPAGTLKCSYDDIYTIYYAQNGEATSSAVDINEGNISEGAYLHLWTVAGQSSQIFRIWRVVDNYYFITPLSNSGLHLNLENGATDNGTRLWLHSALDEASWWGIRNNDDGTVSFYSQKKTSAYIDVTANNQSNGTVIELYEGGEANHWKPVQKYVEQDVVASNGRVGLTAESNGNIVCFYTPSTPLNDPKAIYTAEELSKLGTSGSYYLGCDITVDQVNGSAADIGDGDSTTLDLSGHTIHYNVPENQSACSMIYLHGTGSLTITDSGRAVEATEVVTDLPLYGNLASYDSSTKTLVYYVTESRPNGDGTTTETLVKHTVDLTNVGAVESDTAPHHLIYVADDAVLNIKGGRYTNANGKRAISAFNNSSVYIEGGYLCGCMNYGNEIVGGAVHVNSTGALTISGGVIAANRADKAGGVYKNGGTFSMTGGVISGNQVPYNAKNGNDGTDCRGGGVQIDNAETTISGGYITNNRLDYKCGAVGNGCHFGGGVTLYNATMSISNNCYITGNYSAEAGGGIGFAGQQFIMTGGTVAANVAQTAEGGGIRIQDSSQTSLISGGYVTNNRTNSMHDWGGGGIFVCQGQSLQILNAVFQQNTADGFGGGVGGCSTGQIVAVDNTVGGVAIFDNHANGRTMSGSDGVANSKQDDLTAQANEVFMTNGYNDFFCALNSAVAGRMLGNGAENWHGSCDYKAIDIGKDKVVTANKMMGLNASPTDADKQTAIHQGAVFVSGNYSQTHGGGIMSNGILILGQAKNITLSPGLEIEVYKSFKDENGNTLDLQPGQFQFLLQDANHSTIATVSNNAYGMVLVERDYNQAGTYTYYLKEQPGSNPLIAYDSTEYQITVTVETKTKTLNLSANQSMTITYYVVTDIQVSLSSGTGMASTATSNIDSDNHRATVMIEKDGGTAFTNTMKERPLYFRITKLNGHTNEPLQFVEFTLKDENGNVVTSSKTDKDGHVSLQIEKGKSYRLYETTYKDFMPAGPWILEVDKEGNVIIYDTTTGEDGSISKSGAGTVCTKEEKNVAVYYDHTITNLIGGCELPDTGGAGEQLYITGGLLLMTAAGLLLSYIHFKRRKEENSSS